MPIRFDDQIMPSLVALHECFCAELAKAGLNENCTCALLYGDGATISAPESGNHAWVGISSIFPSKSFPSPDTAPENCAADLVAAGTMGVLRCYKATTRSETQQQMTDRLDLQLADMAAMRRAVMCCAAQGAQLKLGNYTPAGPDGTVYGGAWTFFIGRMDD